MEEKRVIEINGIKMEVDLRDCKRVDSFKVGDNVKCLIKEYDSYKSYAGVIVGFDEFKARPTIIIAYISTSYAPELKYVYLNSESKDVEIVLANENDIPFTKEHVLLKMDEAINKKAQEHRDEISKKEHFLNWFGKYFESKGD